MRILKACSFPILFLLFHSIIYAQNVGINTTNPQAKLDINGDIIIRSLPLFLSDGNNTAVDVNTDRFSNYKITGPTADFVITGISAGLDGRLITFYNKTPYTMYINNEDGTAVITDQIVTGTGLSIDINAGGSVTLQYDEDIAKWVVQSKNHIIAGGGSGGFWDVNGSNIFNNNSGNVGIGINNPLYKFTIQSAPNNYGFVHTDGAVTMGSFVGGGVGGGWIGTVSNHPFHIYTNNGGAQVSFKTDFGMDVKGTKPYIRLMDGITTSGEIKTNSTNLEISSFKSPAIGTPGNLILQIDQPGSLIEQPKYAGNVGIGTTAPVGKVHVVHDGPTAHMILEFPALNDYSRLLFANTGGNRYWGIAGKTGNGPITDDRLSFYNISTGFESMVIVGDGYVSVPGKMGIGTFNPDYKFSVNGSIRSKEVVVESAWADYVFDSGYQLRSLVEVEEFIQQHKHLPDIPSAKEIAEKGLAVGDIQKKMMEKIEELTLYVIELKKEIEKLKTNR